MLDWVKEDTGHADHPMRDAAAAAEALAELRGADPLAALGDLGAWLDSLKGVAGHDAKVRSDILSLIHEASGLHLAALLGRLLTRPGARQATHAANWNLLSDYLKSLTGALCASASLLLREAAANPSLRLAGAAAAARGLHACRMLVKACLIRYVGVPPKLWRVAYVVHGDAEKAQCAETPVHMDAAHKTATSVTQELLRLLMLQSSSPEMMAPAQIETADRVIEQLGSEFTLRPRGVADNPFCFDPASEGRPSRVAAANTELRYFGAGSGYIALERLFKEMTTARTADLKAFGKDIPFHAQVSAIAHLLGFWGESPLFSPAERSPANGTLRVVHGYARTRQHLSSARSGTTELTLAEDGEIAAQPPETWALQDAGDNEVGAEIAKPSSGWARCGDVIGASVQGEAGCWVGVIRSLRTEPGRPLRADFLILGRDPQALQLRAVIAKGEETIFSEESARQFDFNRVRAIILADGTVENPSLLLPPESWAKDRVFEAPHPEGSHFLRAGQLLRRGDDYVQAAFEWIEKPD